MLMTANPHADAERWNDEQQAASDAAEAQEARSAKFFEAALSCEAKAWFTDPVRPYENRSATYSPDELMWELQSYDRSTDHIEVRRLFAELMTSDAALALRKEAARLLAKQFPEAGDLNA